MDSGIITTITRSKFGIYKGLYKNYSRSSSNANLLFSF